MQPQAAMPDTSAYLIAGYVAFAVIFAIYLASFLIRRRNLEQDLKTLETLRAEQATPAARPTGPVQSAASRKAGRRAPGRPKPSQKRGSRNK